MAKKQLFLVLLLVSILFISGCTQEISDEVISEENGEVEEESTLLLLTREETIPEDAIKMTPEMDSYPPVMHSEEWEQPVPWEGPVNSAGAEDSPFMTVDGDWFFFFFTPDVKVPVQEQIIDGVTGIWWTQKIDGEWTEAERVVLHSEISLDGCQFVQDNVIWFCSVRVGNYNEIDFYTAEYLNGEWTNWENAGEEINVEIGVGELHISSDGNEIYFHGEREGGKGGYDLWVIKKIDGEWGEPENLEILNSETHDGWPYLTPDGLELWFTRTYLGSPGIFRSIKIDSEWTEPELILSSFAGEPTLDSEGNIYFVHHFFEYGEMIEADIYVAYKK